LDVSALSSAACKKIKALTEASRVAKVLKATLGATRIPSESNFVVDVVVVVVVAVVVVVVAVLVVVVVVVMVVVVVAVVVLQPQQQLQQRHLV
jgi:Flp pilus assembly protein TadB